MARKWCLEYGVLKWADAEALCKELGVAIVRTGVDKRAGERGDSGGSQLCGGGNDVADGVLEKNVTRSGKSPTNGKKARASMSSNRSGRLDKQEALAADQLELGTGGAFEGIGVSTL